MGGGCECAMPEKDITKKTKIRICLNISITDSYHIKIAMSFKRIAFFD
jgi:hypothetical protein